MIVVRQMLEEQVRAVFKIHYALHGPLKGRGWVLAGRSPKKRTWYEGVSDRIEPMPPQAHEALMVIRWHERFRRQFGAKSPHTLWFVQRFRQFPVIGGSQ